MEGRNNCLDTQFRVKGRGRPKSDYNYILAVFKKVKRPVTVAELKSVIDREDVGLNPWRDRKRSPSLTTLRLKCEKFVMDGKLRRFSADGLPLSLHSETQRSYYHLSTFLTDSEKAVLEYAEAAVEDKYRPVINENVQLKKEIHMKKKIIEKLGNPQEMKDVVEENVRLTERYQRLLKKHVELLEVLPEAQRSKFKAEGKEVLSTE